MAETKVTKNEIDATSYQGSVDANGWTSYVNNLGKTCYYKVGNTGSITLPSGVSLGNYGITGPSGVTLSYTNCIVSGSFMGNNDRAVTSYIYAISSSLISVAVANLYTGGGFTFTPQYQVHIMML